MSNVEASQTVVIVGGGQAAGETALELRKQGFEGRVVILSEESQPPYKRPPLSKAYLAGSVQQEQLFVMQPAILEKHRIDFNGGTKVTAIDRIKQEVILADDHRVTYDRLVLATGGRARPLPVPGADAANVFLLRSIDDVTRIRARCAEGKRAVIVGGGFIGLEVAAVLLKQGLNVTVLEGLDRVLARVTAPEVSAFFERVHREAGVTLHTGAQVAELVGAPEVTAVKLTDGREIAADFVIAGIGLIPNTELAAEAGLVVDNGIVVDEFAQTSDPLIYAAGDCTNHPSAFLERRVRLESVQNAMEQGRIVARNLLGKAEPYQNVPWFWSDQYDLKLQMVGISTGYEQLVLRGNLETDRSFAAFYLKGGKLIAADAVSRPQEFMAAKKMVAQGKVVDPAVLADAEASLKDLAV